MIRDKTPCSHRQDPQVPAFPDTGSVCVMDAQCALCARGARWIANNDQTRAFRIVPLQSDLGRALMRHYGIDPEDPSSWLFLDQGRAFSSLEALIQVGWRLGGVWRGLAIFWAIPKGLRDRLYRLVALNRYRWFGRADLCAMPDPRVQERLLQ